MAGERAVGTDKGVGLAIVAGTFVLAGAAAMLFAPGEAAGAAGFALAVLAGLAVVTVLHLVP